MSFRGKNLHLASFHGDEVAVRRMIARRMDINAKNADGNAAIHFAAGKNHCSILKMLIENGANINAMNEHKKTALHVAVEGCSLEAVWTLIDFGADANIAESRAGSPLHLAFQHINWHKVHAGRNVNSQRMKHLLRQMFVSGVPRNLYLMMAAFLVKYGKADLLRVNEAGQTPLALLSIENDVILSRIELFFAKMIQPQEDGVAIPSRQLNHVEHNKMSSLKDTNSLQMEVNKLRVENKNYELRLECNICCDKQRNVVFSTCGHTACADCGKLLVNCHICKKKIARLQKLFI